MDIGDLRKKAAKGNVAVQTILGICYLDGIDVEVDYQEAYFFLSAAASRGSARAMVNLARVYHEGLGIGRNIPEAVRLYEKAALAGEFLAQIALGKIYSCGSDVPVNRDEALKWYSLAIAQEDRVVTSEEISEAKRYVEAGGFGPQETLS